MIEASLPYLLLVLPKLMAMYVRQKLLLSVNWIASESFQNSPCSRFEFCFLREVRTWLQETKNKLFRCLACCRERKQTCFRPDFNATGGIKITNSNKYVFRTKPHLHHCIRYCICLGLYRKFISSVIIEVCTGSFRMIRSSLAAALKGGTSSYVILIRCPSNTCNTYGIENSIILKLFL